MSSSSSRVGELRGSNYGVNDDVWLVDFGDVANTHPASPFILKSLIELIMPKRKYTRRATATVNAVDPQAGLVTKVATLGTQTDAPSRPRLYPSQVFQKVETIYSDGSRVVEERTFSVNLNP
jgi:hypothetical protein